MVAITVENSGQHSTFNTLSKAANAQLHHAGNILNTLVHLPKIKLGPPLFALGLGVTAALAGVQDANAQDPNACYDAYKFTTNAYGVSCVCSPSCGMQWTQWGGGCVDKCFQTDYRQPYIPPPEPTRRPAQTAIPTRVPTAVPKLPLIKSVDVSLGKPQDKGLSLTATVDDSQRPISKVTFAKGCVGEKQTDLGSATARKVTLADAPLTIGANCFQARVWAVDGGTEVVNVDIPYSFTTAIDTVIFNQETRSFDVVGKVNQNPPIGISNVTIHSCDSAHYLDYFPAAVDSRGVFTGTVQTRGPGIFDCVEAIAIDSQQKTPQTATTAKKGLKAVVQPYGGRIIEYPNAQNPKQFILAGVNAQYIDGFLSTDGEQPIWYVPGIFNATGTFACDKLPKEFQADGQTFNWAVECVAPSETKDAIVKVKLSTIWGDEFVVEYTKDFSDEPPKSKKLIRDGIIVGGSMMALIGSSLIAAAALYYESQKTYIKAQNELVLKLSGDGGKKSRFDLAQDFARKQDRRIAQRLMIQLEKERNVIIRKGASTIFAIGRENPSIKKAKQVYDAISPDVVDDLKLLEEQHSGRVRVDEKQKSMSLEQYLPALSHYVDRVFYLTQKSEIIAPREWEQTSQQVGNINNVRYDHPVAQYCYELIDPQDQDKRTFYKAIQEKTPELAQKIFETGIAYGFANLAKQGKSMQLNRLPQVFQNAESVFGKRLTEQDFLSIATSRRICLIRVEDSIRNVPSSIERFRLIENLWNHGYYEPVALLSASIPPDKRVEYAQAMFGIKRKQEALVLLKDLDPQTQALVLVDAGELNEVDKIFTQARGEDRSNVASILVPALADRIIREIQIGRTATSEEIRQIVNTYLSNNGFSLDYISSIIESIKLMVLSRSMAI